MKFDHYFVRALFILLIAGLACSNAMNTASTVPTTSRANQFGVLFCAHKTEQNAAICSFLYPTESDPLISVPEYNHNPTPYPAPSP